jgi:hypothetical protein
MGWADAFPVPFFNRPKPENDKFPDGVRNGRETARIFLLDSLGVCFDAFEDVGGDASRNRLELLVRLGGHVPFVSSCAARIVYEK